MEVTGGFDPYFTQKPSQKASGRLFMAEKPGFEKKNFQKFLGFFSTLTGGTLWKSMKKISNFFFEPRFFGYNNPSWGPLRRFFGEIWVETTSDLHDFGPEPIWSKWSLTMLALLIFGENPILGPYGAGLGTGQYRWAVFRPVPCPTGFCRFSS